MITPDDAPLHFVSIAPRLAPSTPNDRLRKRLKMLASKITSAWFAVQITHYGGKYSVERMLALEEYSRKTSFSCVLFVVIGTPLPTLVLVLRQESIPLQDPTDGWSVNYGFWIRMAILGFGEGCATTIQTRQFLDGMGLCVWRTVVLSVCVSVGHTAAAILVAAYWVFPIPFVNFTLSSVLLMIFVGTIRILLGSRAFRHILTQREGLRQCACFLSVQMLMVSIYPAYQMLFDFAAHTRYELPVLMLLPVLKLVLRNIVAITLWHKEDMIPEQVILTVDFFDAFYLAMCMQTSSSISTMIVIVTVDFVQTAADLLELHQRTRGILARLGGTGTTHDESSLLSTVRSRCYHSERFGKKMLANVQVRSCISHEVSSEGRALLSKIEEEQHISRSFPHRSRSKVSSFLNAVPQRLSVFIKSRTSVQPTENVVPCSSLEHAISTKCATDRTDANANLNILHESLEVLFTSECLVLTEYLETFVPILYASFILVMTHLPSAQYHTEMEGVTTENVSGRVQNVFIYAALELVSFVVLVVIMWQNCAIRAMYQLAFVLETQALLVQSKLILWVLMTLTYRVTHFGIAWIGHS